MLVVVLSSMYVLTWCIASTRDNQQAHKMNSSDHVRKIVQEEGRTARNLVQYNVLLEDEEVPGMITTSTIGDTITITRIGYGFIVGCFFFTHSMQAKTLLQLIW